MDETVVARFCRYFLLALRTEIQDYNPKAVLVAGPTFEEPFQAALEAARDNQLPGEDWEECRQTFDPAFGVSRLAADMLLHGMRDCLINLWGPNHEWLSWRIQFYDAEKELKRYNHWSSYRFMAKVFLKKKKELEDKTV